MEGKSGNPISFVRGGAQHKVVSSTNADSKNCLWSCILKLHGLVPNLRWRNTYRRLRKNMSCHILYFTHVCICHHVDVKVLKSPHEAPFGVPSMPTLISMRDHGPMLVSLLHESPLFLSHTKTSNLGSFLFS